MTVADEAVTTAGPERRTGGRLHHRSDPVQSHLDHDRDEDEPDAHGVQPDHLRGGGLHGRALRCRRSGRCRSASVSRCSFADSPIASRPQSSSRGRENFEPGDILLTNDPDVMGSHLNHMIFTLPIFNDGELMAFASSMAHWIDVGGVLGGSTQDIYSEGIQIPFVKVYKAGVEDTELTSILRMNCRVPELAMGDMRAQIAAIRTGERRLGDLLRRYGNAAFHESVEMIFDQTERRTRAEVKSIPDGVYEAESFMDDDGVVIGQHIRIAVRIEVRGDQMTIDLSGVGAQVAGCFNSGSTAGRSAAEVAFKFLTSPTIYPINDGAFRALEIILPPGRIISATKPSAMRFWMTVPMTVVDTIFKALAPACPERVIAGHHADLNMGGVFAFINPKTNTAPCRRGSRHGERRVWGRMGCQVGRGRYECRGLPERRRHPQHTGRGQRDVGTDRRRGARVPGRLGWPGPVSGWPRHRADAGDADAGDVPGAGGAHAVPTVGFARREGRSPEPHRDRAPRRHGRALPFRQGGAPSPRSG